MTTFLREFPSVPEIYWNHGRAPPFILDSVNVNGIAPILRPFVKWNCGPRFNHIINIWMELIATATHMRSDPKIQNIQFQLKFSSVLWLIHNIGTPNISQSLHSLVKSTRSSSKARILFIYTFILIRWYQRTIKYFYNPVWKKFAVRAVKAVWDISMRSLFHIHLLTSVCAYYLNISA